MNHEEFERAFRTQIDEQNTIVERDILLSKAVNGKNHEVGQKLVFALFGTGTLNGIDFEIKSFDYPRDKEEILEQYELMDFVNDNVLVKLIKTKEGSNDEN